MVTQNLLDEIQEGHGQTLSRLARLIQPSREGRPTSQSCLFRWATAGVLGPNGERIYLEAARCAGKYISTPGAIRRFIAAQTPERIEDAPRRTPTQQRRAAEQAASELEMLGA